MEFINIVNILDTDALTRMVKIWFLLRQAEAFLRSNSAEIRNLDGYKAFRGVASTAHNCGFHYPVKVDALDLSCAQGKEGTMAGPAIEIIVVSMANATERRARMADIMAKSPFPWRFQDASTGDGSIVPYDSKRARFIKGRDLYPSERGCFESHAGAIRKFLTDSSNDFLIMCEDDVLFDFAFPFGELATAMAEADVGYVRLYSRRIAFARHIQYWRNRWLIRFAWEPFGTQCYMLSKEGAKTLLPFIERISRPIDDQLDRFWENGLPAYGIFPFPVIELQSASSILRPAENQSLPTRLRHKAQRLWDRVVAVTSALRQTKQDNAFAAALRKSGV